MIYYINSIVINTDTIWQTIIGFIISYLIGGMIFAQILSYIHGVDISKSGSGNLGATNVGRVLGKKSSIICFIGDFLKVVIAFGVMIFFKEVGGFDNMLISVALAGTLIGHCFPIFNNFKGGKGVSSGFGLIMVINWVIGLIAITCWIIILKISKLVSLSSLLSVWIAVGLMCIPQLNNLDVLYSFTNESLWWINSIIIIIIAIVITIQHRTNIINILNGKELKGAPKAKKITSDKEKK